MSKSKATKNGSTDKDTDDVLVLELGNYEVQVYAPTVLIDGREIAGLNKKGLLKMQESVKKIYDNEHKKSEFNECEVVRSVLQGPILKRVEETGEVFKDGEGRVTFERFSIDDQRKRNRLLSAIENLTKDKELKPGKSITIKCHATSDNDNRCKWDDLVHVAEHMILYCKDQTNPTAHIPDLHDKYVDLKAAAEAAIEKGK